VRSRLAVARPAVLAGAVATAALVFASVTVRGADQGPVVIPLHVDRGTGGERRLGIDVTVGSKTQRYLLDTGSTGLRVLASSLPDDAYRRTGRSERYGYGTGVELNGEQATAAIGIGSEHGSNESIQIVDRLACTPEYPDCRAKTTQQAEMFGQLYPGIFGALPLPPGQPTCCDVPFGGLDGRVGRTFIVHADFDEPTVTLNPDATMKSAFTVIPIGPLLGPRGCIRIYDVGQETCGPVLFDTGGNQILIMTTGVVPAKPWTHALLRIGSWTHDFDLGLRASGGRIGVSFKRYAEMRIVVGLSALQDLDLYYDLDARNIGLSKP
jgi:hypothetical protein